jgi:hypothetical protein
MNIGPENEQKPPQTAAGIRHSLLTLEQLRQISLFGLPNNTVAYLTQEDVATFLGLSHTHIFIMLSQKRLEAARVWDPHKQKLVDAVSLDSLDKLLDRARVNAQNRKSRRK